MSTAARVRKAALASGTAAALLSMPWFGLPAPARWALGIATVWAAGVAVGSGLWAACFGGGEVSKWTRK